LLGVAAWLAYGVWACVGLRRARRDGAGVLAWDGEAWYWRDADSGAASCPVAPVVCLDLQGLILLRLVPLEPLEPQVRPQRWLWLTPRRDLGRWRALRRALYSIRSRPTQ
jgi:hypothetical protein